MKQYRNGLLQSQAASKFAPEFEAQVDAALKSMVEKGLVRQVPGGYSITPQGELTHHLLSGGKIQ